MLEIIDYDKDEYAYPCLIALGCFDAIHAGHRELLKKAKLQAKINGLDLGVMMFYGGKGGKQVYTFDERVKFLEQFNVKFILKINYDEAFKKIKPLEFLAAIENKINVKAYMSGKDFRFGAGAKGKSSTLKNYAEDEENGVWYMPVKDVLQNGEKVSTTLIKACLQEGDIVKANQLLNSCYSISGQVVNGMGRGNSLGYPTVNINYPEEKIQVKQGVYKVKSRIDGVDYDGIANYGGRPTFNEDEPVLEVYFEGYEGDLYGKTLTVEFVEYLRDIQKFDSADELTAQLDIDVKAICSNEETAEDAVVCEQPAEQSLEQEEILEETSGEACEECGCSCCECESDCHGDMLEESAVCKCEDVSKLSVEKQCDECECANVCQCDCITDCDQCECVDDCETCECEKSCIGCSRECENENDEEDSRRGRRDYTCRGEARGRNGD